MQGEKPAKSMLATEMPTGFFKMASGFGATMDQAHQNTAPLNFRDVRDARAYRGEVSAAKDNVLARIRTTDNAQERTRLILAYRFLQRYHKVDPVPISPEHHALRSFLSNRMDQHIAPGTRAAAHKSYFDSLYDIQQYVVDAIARVQVPDLFTLQQAAYFPKFDRYHTLNKAEQEKQIAARPQFDEMTQAFASTTLPEQTLLSPREQEDKASYMGLAQQHQQSDL